MEIAMVIIIEGKYLKIVWIYWMEMRTEIKSVHIFTDLLNGNIR